MRIGIDDFASKLVGKVEHVTLPQRGQWIRQGQKVWSIIRNGVKVDMVSPIEGSVSDINEAVMADPSLAGKDPYGEGWMVTVQSPDAKTNFRNLLGGALARWWTEESSMRLQRVMPSALGALAQDGGVAIDDLASTMPDEQWTKITREFFLTRGSNAPEAPPAPGLFLKCSSSRPRGFEKQRRARPKSMTKVALQRNATTFLRRSPDSVQLQKRMLN